MNTLEESTQLQLAFDKHDGLLPVAVQDSQTGTLLMVAYVNQEAFEHSVKTGLAAFWSRSRCELWVKGLTTGNTLKIDEILVDCDQDALLYRVSREAGGACHTKQLNGEYRLSCFYRKMTLPDMKLVHIEDHHNE